MATTTIYGTTGDGRLYATYSLHYSEARDAASADSGATGNEEITVGWYDLYKRLYRSYWYFTASLPTGSEISAGTLHLYLANAQHSPPVGHEIVLMHADSYPSDTLALSDFDRTKYKSGGAPNVKVWAGQSGYKSWVLNSTGCGWVSPTGATRFCLMSEFDVSPSNPGNQRCNFYSALKGGGYRPKLDLTYGIKPTVTTSGSTSVAHSSAVGHGVLDTTGSDSITEVGVIWNDDGSDPTNLSAADNSVTGTLAAEAWQASLSGLTPQTKYQYRAYATSSVATGYGSTGNFTTTTSPATLSVHTLMMTTIGSSTATLRGTIISNAGDGITQHGFIYKANSDPYEPAAGPISNPTGADHYILLGTGSEGVFTHGATGLSAGTAYLVRAFAQTTGGTNYGGVYVVRTGSDATGTYYGSAGQDGYLTINARAYSAPDDCCDVVAAATGADLIVTGSNLFGGKQIAIFNDRDYGGQDKCFVVRGYIYIDTSSIPADATVQPATLSLYVVNHDPADPGSLTVFIYDGQPTYPSEPLAKTDFDTSNYSEIARLSNPNITNLQYNSFTIPAAYINAGGITKFCVGIGPECQANTSSLRFYAADYTTAPPKLEVTYSLPSSPALPQVTIGGTATDMDEALVMVDGQYRLITAATITVSGAQKSCA